VIARLRGTGAAAAALLVLGLLGCGRGGDDDGEPAPQPVAIADQEGAVCGMLVRDQPAPRAQVVHRDGTRVFFCSLGDMLVDLSAPSPHGRAQSLFVEVMGPDEDPTQPHTGAHRWVPAADAVFVVGIAREGIMGEPVLAYADRADADAVIQGHPGARSLDFAALRRWWNAREAAR